LFAELIVTSDTHKAGRSNSPAATGPRLRRAAIDARPAIRADRKPVERNRSDNGANPD
jgi:hypothetical protein